jgi:hypothetical protein
MRRSILAAGVLIGLALLFGAAGQSKAILVGGQDMIAAPPSIVDDPPGAVNEHQQAFNERQNVPLAAPLAVDGGFIAAGTVVNSHMIFLNTEGDVGAVDDGVEWTFNGPILGVMSDQGGTLEAASSPILGAPGTTYPGAFPYRGMEPRDSYTVAGNKITVNMGVSEPGDWIRVVTAATEIDIKPGSDPNSINPMSKGVIPVAILTTEYFDATQVDAETVVFAGAMKEHRRAHVEDADYDGDLDLVLHFATRDTDIAPGDTYACLTGETYDGMPIIGCDSVRTVP